MPVSLAAIEEARRRIAGSAIRTPLVRLNGVDGPADLPDGSALFSLRPENLRLVTGNSVAANSPSAGLVRVHGKVLQQAFHGATELIRVACAEGLVLVVRTATSAGVLQDVQLEFSPTDAIPVRESPERI